MAGAYLTVVDGGAQGDGPAQAVAFKCFDR
jgi:hypothetical protein